jgi:hypothetical protein
LNPAEEGRFAQSNFVTQAKKKKHRLALDFRRGDDADRASLWQVWALRWGLTEGTETEGRRRLCSSSLTLHVLHTLAQTPARLGGVVDLGGVDKESQEGQGEESNDSEVFMVDRCLVDTVRKSKKEEATSARSYVGKVYGIQYQ